jgi:CHAT domain-containing protein
MVLFSHAKFSEQVEESYIMTFDSQINLNKLETLIETPKRAIEFLTLAACETAKGSSRAALGLSGIAFKAGARSAMGTLWPVNEIADRELLDRFYRRLKETSIPKVKVLQRVQQEFITKGVPPHHWSPFLLIGNWL